MKHRQNVGTKNIVGQKVYDIRKKKKLKQKQKKKLIEKQKKKPREKQHQSESRSSLVYLYWL